MGTRLPAERRLAEDLGVSRLSLRAALATLENEGLVRARQGSGIEVLDYRESASLDLFSWLLDQHNAPAEQLTKYFEEMIHLRRVLALDVLVQAAQNATAEDLEQLQTMVADQKLRLDDVQAYLAGDQQFQRVILRLAGSTAAELLFNSLEKLVWHHQDLVLAFMGPLHKHHAAYGPVLQLLRKKRPQRWTKLAEVALDLIEAQGLRRVRKHLQKRTEEK